MARCPKCNAGLIIFYLSNDFKKKKIKILGELEFIIYAKLNHQIISVQPLKK